MVITQTLLASECFKDHQIVPVKGTILKNLREYVIASSSKCMATILYIFYRKFVLLKFYQTLQNAPICPALPPLTNPAYAHDLTNMGQ